ncbi:hypothetical protein SAMN02745172_03684 [Pseudoxanthobacter soli DSM 19599]|uniref:Uncharacterized protein n=1 Tax=Pseudoxanthobacter soli DSM 19599 TaxID=1123029 RepID=A0A1M7ZQC7_9HYPH|nr:hypothetical protein [Pseudoxanthobacter soli]SHO67022.1 hypothetical protein SAMN02745172_03684 [Pseudoxanthobacter soli DSM 19599]
MIQRLPPAGVLERTARSLALATPAVAESLVAQALRRAVSALAPCSRAEALRFVRQPLDGLMAVTDEWYEDLLDALIAYGDVLEVTRQEQDAWRTGRLVLRPAPPSFVRRANGDLIILGVAGDQPTALLGELAERLEYRGPLRTLREAGAVDLLKALGLVELPETAWLRAPVTASAQGYAELNRGEVLKTPLATAPLDGLSLIDPGRPVTYYSGRWRPPASGDTGVFIARRQQLFGLRPWCLVELEGGAPRRLHDLVATDNRERPCDLAWRIQAAFDASAGRPQQVQATRTRAAVELAFFSPLPAFAERRLALKGEKSARAGCLFAYTLPPAAAADELDALSEKLWLMETS